MSEMAWGWLSQGELVALGWTLVHSCWQGALVGLLFGLVDRITSRTRPAVRYAVALGALALLPLMAATTFAIELERVTPMTRSVTSERSYDAVQAKSETGQTPAVILRGAGHREAALLRSAERLLPWVDGVWILGVMLLAVRAMGGWLQLEQMRRRARGIVPVQVERGFRRMCEQMRVGRSVVLRISDEVISPLVMGVWRATVILPASILLHLSSEEMEAVLAHELGHIRRWDFACNLAQTAVESVLFFHPAVWWISGEVRDRREVCCDAIAVEHCAGAVVYARALLRLEEQKAVELRLAVALRGRGGSLLGRVEQVLGEHKTMENRMTSGVRVAMAGAVVLGLLLLPKVSDAVAKPLVGGSRPAMAQVVAKAEIAAMPEPQPRAAVSAKANEPKPLAGDAEIAALKADRDGLRNAMIAAAVQDAKTSESPKGVAYLDGMREAGYPLDLNNDLDALVSMKALGVTPDYAKAMGAMGLGKPTLQELISMKALGVTPEYVTELKDSGMGPKTFEEVVSEKALGLTPKYAADMKKAGFGDLDVQGLISLKAQGMTPEYAQWLKKEFPEATVDELTQAAVFHLDDKFLAAAKAHGFDGKDLEKLLRLKISGLLDE